MDLKNRIYDACTVKFATATGGQAESTLITQPLVRVRQRLATLQCLKNHLIEELSSDFLE